MYFEPIPRAGRRRSSDWKVSRSVTDAQAVDVDQLQDYIDGMTGCECNYLVGDEGHEALECSRIALANQQLDMSPAHVDTFFSGLSEEKEPAAPLEFQDQMMVSVPASIIDDVPTLSPGGSSRYTLRESESYRSVPINQVPRNLCVANTLGTHNARLGGYLLFTEAVEAQLVWISQKPITPDYAASNLLPNTTTTSSLRDMIAHNPAHTEPASVLPGAVMGSPPPTSPEPVVAATYLPSWIAPLDAHPHAPPAAQSLRVESRANIMSVNLRNHLSLPALNPALVSARHLGFPTLELSHAQGHAHSHAQGHAHLHVQDSRGESPRARGALQWHAEGTLERAVEGASLDLTKLVTVNGLASVCVELHRGMWVASQEVICVCM